MKTNYYFILINPSLWFDTLIFSLFFPDILLWRFQHIEESKEQFSECPHAYHLHSAINTWLSCAPVHLSIYLIVDVFQSKLLVSVPLVPKHSGTFLLHFKFFMPFENFQSSPEVSAGNNEPSFRPCCSHFHGQSGVDSSNSLTGSVSLRLQALP